MSSSLFEAEPDNLHVVIPQVMRTRSHMVVQGYISTIAFVNKRKFTSRRTKHIVVRYFFIKDKVDEGMIEMDYTPMIQMLGEALTKRLNFYKVNSFVV